MLLRSDPLTIFAFAVAHFAMLTVVSTLVFPRWMDPLIPSDRREEGNRTYAPQTILGADDIRLLTGVEAVTYGEKEESSMPHKATNDVPRSDTDGSGVIGLEDEHKQDSKMDGVVR